MATKAFKNEKIQQFKEIISNAKVAIVVDYRGLTVAEITDLRRLLQKENSDCTVTKNTLAKIAILDTPFANLSELLAGPSALVLGFEDQVAPAKILTQFIKKAKKVEIKGGSLDGSLLTANDVRKLADMPSKEELLAKMLGSINAPAQGILNVVNGVPKALVIAMDAIRKQKESA